MKKKTDSEKNVVLCSVDMERKVPMNIALTAEDKQFLKLYAIKHDTNVSALIAEYIKGLRDTEQ